MRAVIKNVANARNRKAANAKFRTAHYVSAAFCARTGRCEYRQEAFPFLLIRHFYPSMN
jgi:hypothetical protein